MNIYSLPSHVELERTSGVDFARIIQPMKALDGYKDIKSTVYDPKEEEKHNDPKDWISVMDENDIFYFNYLNNPWGFAAMGMMARKNGVKIVMDMDDDLWDVHRDNPAWEVYQKGSVPLRNFTLICNEVDYITCTNDYLKNVIINNTNKRPDQIKVFPNYVDLKLYKHKPKFRNDPNRFVIGHYGSGTHYDDLKETDFIRGVNRIMKEFPHVVFKSIGSFSHHMRKDWGMRYEQGYGHQDIYHWIQDEDRFAKFMDEIDVLAVPLVDDIYNRCKSSIKWIETSSAGKPGIWQDIRQYQEVVDGTNGLLAKKDTQWYNGIKSLILDADKRKEMGENAYKTVKKDWQIQDHLEEYHQFFTKVLDK
jgi:glycosyltransferase involved in cell wall biosynthesis